ncbi:phage baseplate protein [Cetobacterium sp.]|uniref:phage baseplate protein n=1 Tax=Cetobacterium sp. TaxID=2071632 RepID=UPI003EE66283
MASTLILLDNSNPAILFPGTTWEKIEGRFIMGTSGSETPGLTGGSGTVTLNLNNIPSHNHSISVSISAGGNHRHQVDNHIHSQPSHAHTIPMSTPGYFSSFNWNSVYTGVIRSGNGDTSRGGLAAGGENTGGAAPFTNYSGDHGHGVSASVGNSGGGAAFSILPPHIKANIWKRLT